ncbi:MAG: hypothetical protein CBR30_09195 [Dictyoglomus sp. NZ13-RE01]|nr:MAG: hypothetical protein CBR30_09195 [Dictyoglomus sp. NZ13-RE01]
MEDRGKAPCGGVGLLTFGKGEVELPCLLKEIRETESKGGDCHENPEGPLSLWLLFFLPKYHHK